MNIAGSVEVSATTINWFDYANTTSGTFTVEPPASGYFADPGNGGTPIYQPFPFATGTSLDLNSATSPINTPLALNDFLSGFTTANPEYNDLNFQLQFIEPATGSQGTCTGNIAVGQSCSLGAFSIQQTTANTLTVSLTLEGVFNDPSLGLTSLLATGAYSTQGNLLVAGTSTTVNTVSQLLAVINSGGAIQASYSAAYSVPAAAVPEPATLLLLGTGLLGAGFGRKRWGRKP